MEKVGKVIFICLLGVLIVEEIIIGVALSKLMISYFPGRFVSNYGEFSYRLVYELDGDIITLEENFSIEYEGIDYNAGDGIHNDWDFEYKDDLNIDIVYGKYPVLLKNLGRDVTGSELDIIFYIGSEEYYMVGVENAQWHELKGLLPGDICIGSAYKYRALTEEELYEQYNIRIIEKFISPPLTA